MYPRKWGGRCAQTGHPLKLPSPTKLAWLGRFPPPSQAGRLAGPVFYVYVFFSACTSHTVYRARICEHLTLTNSGSECQAFSPVVRIGSSAPSPATECCPPPFGSKGGTHSLAGEGGEPIRTKGQRQTLWYSGYYSIIPLRYTGSTEIMGTKKEEAGQSLSLYQLTGRGERTK